MADATAKRRWYQFYLWHLVVLMTLACVVTACVVTAWKEYQRAKAIAREEAMQRDIADVYAEQSLYTSACASAGGSTCGIGLAFSTDAELAQMGTLRIEAATLTSHEVTDEGLACLRNRTTLTSLDLLDTQVTDKGLKHLHGLTNLNEVRIFSDRVTQEGIEELQAALPKCQIHFRSRSKEP